MLRASVLGKLYSYWLCSAIFNILRGIYRPFSRAFRHSAAVRFLYGTGTGRAVLRLMQKGRADRLVVGFLKSPLSKPFIRWYAGRHGLRVDKNKLRSYRSFRDFFARRRRYLLADMTPRHLISPCDGWLSAFPVDGDSGFEIKGSRYKLSDLLGDAELAARFGGGDCLIYRLCPADYHRYCYIDDGYQGDNHHIPGELHSVQPAACAKYPVYTLNRRCWTLLATEKLRACGTDGGGRLCGWRDCERAGERALPQGR